MSLGRSFIVLVHHESSDKVVDILQEPILWIDSSATDSTSDSIAAGQEHVIPMAGPEGVVDEERSVFEDQRRRNDVLQRRNEGLNDERVYPVPWCLLDKHRP